MTVTREIEKFEDLIEIGTTFGQNWFRGHSKVIGELTPLIFRSEYTDSIYINLNPNPEFRIAINFKREAPSIIKELPEYSDHLEWLFLMQHHGTPTRLLDWSENILIAAFFAINSDYNEDAEIWSIFPWHLNNLHGWYGLPLMEDKTLSFLAHEIFHNNAKELAEEYGLKDIPRIPMAFSPPLSHPRITAQQSCFTIHPEPQVGFSIPEVIKEEKYLVRYIIRKRLKKEIEKKLMYLGITYRTIYPDLDGLAKSIKQSETFPGWSQPEPLKFKEYKKK